MTKTAVESVEPKNVVADGAGFTPTPGFIAASCLIAGTCLCVAGVYVLAGPGWALIAAAVPTLLLSVVLLRGLINAG